MNSKTLLVAFSCLLATAHARPASAPPTGCSLSCSGRNFWTGYKAGTTLQYAFEQKVEVSYSLSQQRSVLMQSSGKASVEVHSDCEMVLTVDLQATKTSKSPAEAASLDQRQLPKALTDALKEPLRFSFEDGRIIFLCPSASETRASLNFKRGLLSQLHLSIDKPTQDARVREDDVLGNCWTVYKSLGGNKIEKTKDLSSCTSNFEVFPRKGVKFEAPEQMDSRWPTVVQGNLKCAIELDGESSVIKENLCVEERAMENNLGEEGVGETVKVTTSLRLEQKLSSLASALRAVGARSDLNHKHKTGDKCHDSKAWFDEDIFHSGNECLEKKLPAAGTASADFKLLATTTISELCEETKSNDMLNTTAAKYADLIKYLRGITAQEDFNNLFEWIKGNPCEDNNMLKTIAYSAIASTGTRQSVQVILNELKNTDPMASENSNTDNWLIGGIASMPHPTPSIIKDVLDFTKKIKDESMQIISKEHPLALSAITGRYCAENRDCANDTSVWAVLTFFSESLGVNCSKLESSEDPGYDYAFASLLSTGNTGRAIGGPGALIGCAENAKLSLANRVFALQALRRFPELGPVETLRVGEIIKSRQLDSELRITAYQVVARFGSLSFWSDERVITRLSNLLQDDKEDQQVQRYVHSHLSQWLRKQRQSTDSYTVSNVLREYEKVIADSKLSGMQVSGYWRKAFKNPSTKSKAELESNIVYSSKSIMPRLVNFNFTVETPLSAEAINMFELGLRMEGMESMVEQAFNILNKDNKQDDELVRKRRQAAAPELKEEQKQYKQTPTKQRLDVFFRKNGMELMHNNFDDSILGVVPNFMKTLDFDNVKGLAGEKLSSIKMDTVGQAAGTLLETTISIPTIAGFAILLKKELHYLSNIGFKQTFEIPSKVQVKMSVELQPTVSVYMARTVLVDTGFERAGVKSRTSGLSSTGVKLSVEGKADDLNDILLSFKMDPLKKQQKILEVKTEIVFVQHSKPSSVVETPVVPPSELAPVTSKCFTPASVKLFGRRLCLETSFGRTFNPLAFVRQNPGSFRLYVEKNESFGVFEATIQFKSERDNFNVLAVVGDQTSKDRHAKFLFSLATTPQSRKITLELANPVLPIKWESESTAKGSGFDVAVALKFGSTDFVFKGTRTRDEEGCWKLDGNFYRKDKERQQLGIVTKFASYGLLKYVPLFRFDLTATTPTNDKLTFNHLVNYDSKNNKFELSLLASHEKSGSVVTSVKSRLQYNRMQRDSAGQTRALLYDTEVVNKNGKNFLHTFSAKIDRKRKGTTDTWESTLAVNHKFKHGVTKEKSIIDMDATLKLEEVIKPGQSYKATGSGSLNYEAESGKKTVKLTKLTFVVGESDVIDDHFDTKTLLLEYATDLDGTQSHALAAVQVLPITKWRADNQCVYFTLKATKTTGADSKTHAFELRHTASRDKQFADMASIPSIQQVAKIVYSNQVLFDAAHKFYPTGISNTGGAVVMSIRHFFNVTTYDATQYFLENLYTAEMSQRVTVKVTTTVNVNQERRIRLNHTVIVDAALPRVEYKLVCERPTAVGSFRVYWQDSGIAERRRNAAEIASYLRSAQREGFSASKFFGLVQKFIFNIKAQSGFELTQPSFNLMVTNYIDMSVTDGILANFTRIVKSGDRSMTRSLVIFKQLENTKDAYRRFYRVLVNVDGMETEYKSEAMCTKSSNPKVTLSLSKAQLNGLKGGEFSVTTVGQYFPRHQRDGQIALHLNTTCECAGVQTKSNLRVIVDTAHWMTLNPTLNVSHEVTAYGKSFNTLYNLGLQKPDPRETVRSWALTSDLTLTNTFATIPFRTYKGITTVSTGRDALFNFVFRKQLDTADLINFQTTLNSEMLYIGAKSDVLPVTEVSYKAQYKTEPDRTIAYLSEIKFAAQRSWDISIQDKGKLKVTGRINRQLFSAVYSGSLTFKGLEPLIGRQVTLDRLDYSGLLDAKETGEFDTFFKVDKVQGTSSENVGFLSTKFSVWPFEISSQIKTPLWSIDHYGFNISAGRKSQGNDYWAKVWIASPMKQSTLSLWHKCSMAQKTDMTGQATLQSDHLFELKSDKIESFLVIKGNSLFDYTFSMNLTTPYKQVQLVKMDVAHGDSRQTSMLTLKSDDRENVVLDFDYRLETKTDGTKVGLFRYTISPMGSIGFRNLAFSSYVVVGNDYLYGIDIMLNNARLCAADFLWITTGTSYSQFSKQSVSGANVGFELSGFSQGAKTFQFYLLRSGDAAKSQWQMRYKYNVEVDTKVELINGKITSGTGTALGKSITFSSPSEGVIEVKAASTKDTITFSSKMGEKALQSLTMKFSIGGKESCLSYNKQGQQVNAAYGACSKPNTIKISYDISNIWQVTKTKVQASVEHTTYPENQYFYLLPGLEVYLMTSAWPFKLSMDGNNELRTGKMSFESAELGVKYSHEYDLSKFPSSLTFKRTMATTSGPMKWNQTTSIFYDWNAGKVNVKTESPEFKLLLTNEEFSIEATGLFTAGVKLSAERSTEKYTIETKWEWRPAAGSQPCVLRLSRSKITGGTRLALEFVEHSSKELSIVTDVTNYLYQPNVFTMNVETTLSSTLIANLRSAKSSLVLSVLRDRDNRNYTIEYKESFTAGGVLYYELDSIFKGQDGRFPSTMKIAFPKGYIETEFSYNFNRAYGNQSYLLWSVSKFGDQRDLYLVHYRTQDVSHHVGKFWRDFSLEISSPRRQVYLSESCKLLPNGTVQTEVQAFLNKRNAEGIVAVFNRDFTTTNVYKRSFQLTLPTRQVGYERVLTVDGNKLGYNITIFWDIQTALAKKITIQFSREKERRQSGYYYYHRLDMTAPFLKNKVTKEVLYERKDNEVKISLSHTQGSEDKVTLTLTGRQSWDAGRSAFQKEVNISFTQQKGDVKANVRINVDASKLSGPRPYSGNKLVRVINIYTTVPSLSVDSHVRIRFVPKEEFTYACNHGATFSFRYYTGYKRSRLFLFVSNSKKEAGQLTVVRDWLMSTWEATLDTGKGYMDPKSVIGFPIYEPTKVVVKASAGFSSNRKKLHFGVVTGPMAVTSAIKLWKPETVPADLDFFFVGIKLSEEDNTMGYASHWRIRRETMKSPYTYLKEVLVDPWAKATNLPVGTDTINKLLRPIAQSKSRNIDTDVVLDMLTSISSNDIDSLKRWAAKARENNEFLSNTIALNVAYGFQVVRMGVEGWVAAVRSPYNALPSDLGILRGISALFDAATRALNNVPITRIWSSTLTTFKYVSDQLSSYFTAYVDKLDTRIRERISGLTGGKGSSILDMVFNAVSSVYPVQKAFEKIAAIAEVYAVGLFTADVELATQVGNALQPFFISTLAEIPKVYDFLDNLFYEINQWSVYIGSLVQAVFTDTESREARQSVAGSIKTRVLGQTVFSQNTITSLGMLVIGDYSGAIRQFFNTNANEVRVWRLECDQACLDSGSFAAINGTLYLPFDVSSAVKFSPRERLTSARDALRSYGTRRQSRRQKLKDALEELQSERGFGGVIRRLVSPQHRTAEAAGSYINTFGGTVLRNLAPCRYLLAHDFLNADFSVFQTYTWEGRDKKRGDLLVRFFKAKVTITNSNEVKLDSTPTRVPFSTKVDDLTTVEAKGSGDKVTVKFHSELQNALEVKCRRSTNSCSVRVHPLYHGRLNGAFGSNDGNDANDLHANSDSEHMRLWVTDSCVQS